MKKLKSEEIKIKFCKQEIPILNDAKFEVKLDELNRGVVRARRYRNRKLGDFLKELDLTEGKATGIPTIIKEMTANGSPAALFETDEARTFFVRLPSPHREVNRIFL